MEIYGYIISSIFLIFIVWIGYKISVTEKIKSRELQKRLESDDFSEEDNFSNIDRPYSLYLDQCFSLMKRKGFQLKKTDSSSLNGLYLFKKYSYSNLNSVFVIENNVTLFFVEVEYDILLPKRREFHKDINLLLKIKTNCNHGHHIFTKETIIDKLLDTIRNDDIIELNGFEPTTLNTSTNPKETTIFLKKLEGLKNVEIEIINESCFIKTNRNAREQDLKMLLSLAEKIK